MSDNSDRDELVVAAKRAAENSYSPYSGFKVGAALRFADGTIVTGTNIENASYGLTLCAETIAVAQAMAEGHRGGLVEVAVFSPALEPTPPCGRCRQVLLELAELGETDPTIWCAGESDVIERKLSFLLPDAFGPASLVR